jgi:hypothetical protein
MALSGVWDAAVRAISGARHNVNAASLMALSGVWDAAVHDPAEVQSVSMQY